MEFEEPPQRQSCCRKEKERDMSNIKFVNSSGLYFGPRISGGKSVRMFNPTYKLHGHIYNPTTNSKLPWATQSCSMGWIRDCFHFTVRINESTFQPAFGSETGVWLWSPFGEGRMISKNSVTRYVVAAFCWDLWNLQSFEKPQGWWRIDLFEGWKCLTVSNMSFFVHKIYFIPLISETFPVSKRWPLKSKSQIPQHGYGMLLFWLLTVGP